MCEQPMWRKLYKKIPQLNAFLAVQWTMKALPGSKYQASVTNFEAFAEVGEIYGYNSSWM